jgi:hypothetical protein
VSAMNEDRDPDRQPSLIRMMGLVAFSVAITILVFFALGYVFGRVFL